MTCEFEVNDGAYLLGALAPAERAEFEDHLAACPHCRESVAQLAVLPGLLSRLDAQLVASRQGGAGGVTAPPEVLPRVISAARSRRRVQRRRQVLGTAAACVAAAALATAVGLGAQLANGPDPGTAVIRTGEPVVFTAMQPAGDYGRVVAEIGLRPEADGTVVEVRCLYHGQNQGSWPIWLVVYPRDEEAEAIGSWVARSGAQAAVTAVTHYTPAQIERIELQGVNHTTLAWWRP